MHAGDLQASAFFCSPCVLAMCAASLQRSPQGRMLVVALPHMGWEINSDVKVALAYYMLVNRGMASSFALAGLFNFRTDQPATGYVAVLQSLEAGSVCLSCLL